MSCYYILQNQDHYFFGKDKSWVDGRDNNALFKTAHKDEALNQLFEANSRDVTLRIQVIACDIDPKGRPLVPDDILPPLAMVCDDNEETSQINDNDEKNAPSEVDVVSSQSQEHTMSEASAILEQDILETQGTDWALTPIMSIFVPLSSLIPDTIFN